jgi:hypothetical protein
MIHRILTKSLLSSNAQIFCAELVLGVHRDGNIPLNLSNIPLNLPNIPFNLSMPTSQPFDAYACRTLRATPIICLQARKLMMMILLLFLQKQNLAFAVYLLGSVLSLPD